MIDRLGLYNTIFTNPVSKDSLFASTQQWNIAYDGLAKIIDAPARNPSHLPNASLLKALLLRGDNEFYLAWVLAALVPWADIENSSQTKATKRVLPPIAAEVVREGLKLENKVTKIAADSVTLKREIVDMVEDVEIENPLPESPSSKRKQAVPRRDILGFAIRKWGPNWRSSYVFALLCRLKEVDGEKGTFIACELHQKTNQGHQMGMHSCSFTPHG